MEAIIDFLKVIGILLLVVMVFNVLIIVHEWGHFLAARWRGLKVDRFQIWFGKPIWKKTYNGVQYGLGSIPAGGFVALPQMAPMEAIEGKNTEEGGQREELPPISPLDKIIVAFAGPLFSFLLAVFFAVVVWVVGKPEAANAASHNVGWVYPESPAAAAGFQVGDEIVSVDGKPIKHFHGMIDSVDWNVITSEREQIPFVINRPGKGEMTLTLEKDLDKDREEQRKEDEKLSWYSRLFYAIFSRPGLFDSGLRGEEIPMIANVLEHGPADEAGLRSKDLIVKIDGKPVTSRFQVIDFIDSQEGKTFDLTYQRDGVDHTVQITPRVPDRIPKSIQEELEKENKTFPPKAGFDWDDWGKSKIDKPTPIAQITDSFRVITNTLSAVFSPKTGVSASHLSGPVGIMDLYYRLFDHPDGWRLVIWFSVVLNINLAILNLLPLPVLDGGHIVMGILEGIRRKPLNFRALEVIQTVCVVFLLGFMLFVTMKDTGALFGRNREMPAYLPPDQREQQAKPETQDPSPEPAAPETAPAGQ